MTNNKSAFAGIISEGPKKERPSEPEIPKGPAARPQVPQVDVKSPPIERMIAWLFRWPKDTIKTVDIPIRTSRTPRQQKRKSFSCTLRKKWLVNAFTNAPIL